MSFEVKKLIEQKKLVLTFVEVESKLESWFQIFLVKIWYISWRFSCKSCKSHTKCRNFYTSNICGLGKLQQSIVFLHFTNKSQSQLWSKKKSRNKTNSANLNLSALVSTFIPKKRGRKIRARELSNLKIKT